MMQINKKEWALGILLTVLIAAVMVVGVAYYEAQITQEAKPQPASDFITALETYPLASAMARRWHEDAQLSRVTAVWRQPTETELLSGKTSWAFYFYSPSAQQTYIISAVGQTVSESQVNSINQPPSLIPLADWRVDSPQAIGDFLDHGGRQFLQSYPQSNVHLDLSVSETGQVEWSIIGLSAPDQPTVLFFLNAMNGLNNAT